MYIGEAAKKSGATVKAIRLYEKLGLLSNISRDNSYRVYTEEDVRLIKFIKVAQSFDFKLLELKAIINPDGNLTSWENIGQAIYLKEQKIDSEISRLRRHKKELKNYRNEIKQCLFNNSDCFFPQVHK